LPSIPAQICAALGVGLGPAGVRVAVAARVGARVAVPLGRGVNVAVAVNVGVLVGVSVGTRVAVNVAVGASVGVGVGVGAAHAPNPNAQHIASSAKIFRKVFLPPKYDRQPLTAATYNDPTIQRSNDPTTQLLN
jgi:hypothetical protein